MDEWYVGFHEECMKLRTEKFRVLEIKGKLGF